MMFHESPIDQIQRQLQQIVDPFEDLRRLYDNPYLPDAQRGPKGPPPTIILKTEPKGPKPKPKGK